MTASNAVVQKLSWHAPLQITENIHFLYFANFYSMQMLQTCSGEQDEQQDELPVEFLLEEGRGFVILSSCMLY